MVARLLVSCVLILPLGATLAQPKPVPGAVPAPEAPTPPTAAAAAPITAAEQGPPGDLITFKNGRVYRGFQVVRSSSSEIELEVTPEVTIRVPRRQIVSIAFDDIDPVVEREQRKAAEAAASEATMRLLSGQKVPPALQAKLSADISNPPMNYDKRDIVDAVGELNKLPAIAGLLELDKPVLNMPTEQRQWTFASAPGTTLAAALEALKKSIPGIATVIRDDKLLITDEKTARDIVTTQEAPAAPPAPGAAPPATPAPAATPPPSFPSAPKN